MKFIVSSGTLLKNLLSINGVLNSSNSLPILDNFLFELSGDVLKITASDLETTMSITMNVTKSDEDNSVAIPAKFLIDTLKTFPDIPLTFTINMETFLIEISAESGKYKFTGHDAEEYPQTPVLENGVSIEINSEILARAFNKTLFATGNDDMRIVMTGVFCQLSDNDVTFVATDAHKLVRYRRTDIKSSEISSFIIPKKPLNLAKNILSSYDVPVKIEYNKTNVSFEFENVKMVCRLIDGKYPNYEAVIPINNTKKLTVNRQEILTAIRRVSIFSNQLTRQIRFSIAGQELILSSEDIELSNEAKERLNCRYEGEDIEIGFNSKFILEMISNLDSEEICIEMSAPNRAALIFPAENANEGEEILMLIMPVVLNQ